VDGTRHETMAQNLGDWYDGEAVVGFLNGLLRERESDLRYVLLPTSDQSSAVLLGPSKGLLAAVERGLLLLADPRAPVDAGKAFERRALDHLKQRGVVVE